MNGSRAAALTVAWRLASFRSRLEGLPAFPIVILGTLALLAIFADFIAPHDPQVGLLGERFRPPAWQAGGSTAHLLGTDHVGRDVLSRLIFGARISMTVGFTAVIFAGVVGTTLGILAGYLGGWVDQVIMRVTDAWLALPALTFAIFLAAIVGPSASNIVIIMALVYWTRYARVVRGEVLSLKERDYVRLAIVAGCSKRTIMKRHILPNVVNSSIVLATLMLGVVIVTEAALSFLGVGVPPPQPAWGLMLADGEKLGIVGESGSGKTTLALSLLRLLPPAARIIAGAIRFEGEDLLAKRESEMRHIRGKRIAMILQDPMASLNPLFTIGDQVGEPLRVHEGASRRGAWERARELLGAVRISAPNARVRNYPHELSGGMRQRIVGAIAISCGPRLLIADEPTTSLDVTIQAQYLSLLRELQRAQGLALIFITHNLGIVARMCDKVAVMYGGRIVESGPVRRIFGAPAHPYTRALIESIPKLGDSNGRLTAIEGQPPDPAALPHGCAFHPHWPVRLEQSATDRPRHSVLGARHRTACWLHG